jgi:AraC-like DNA-binding protein
MNKTVFILSFCAILLVSQAQAQPKSITHQVDSIEALLPQLRGEERFNAIASLTHLTAYTPEEKYYVKMFLDEARKQKDIEREVSALQLLTQIYSKLETDTVFIFGEEAIRLAQEHKLYDQLFSVRRVLIRRLQTEGLTLTALRKAEEAYEEAKNLQENNAMAQMLSVIGSLYSIMRQHEEAVRYYTESNQTAAIDWNDRDLILFINNYVSLAYMSEELNRPSERKRYADSLQMEVERLLQMAPNYNVQYYCFMTAYHKGMAYAEMNQPKQALEAIREAEELYESHWKDVNKYFAVQLDEMYGTYYFALGNYEKALEHLNRVVEYGEEQKMTFVIIKKKVAQAHFENGNYKKAAEIYLAILNALEDANHEQFYAQVNELRSLYQLDKAELESEKQRAAIKQQRIIIGGLILACFTMMFIVMLVVRNRRKIAKKNHGLYNQILEQDRLLEELEAEREKNLELQMRHKSVDEPLDDNEENSELFFQKLTALMKKTLLFTNCEIKRKDVAKEIGISDRGLHDCIKNASGMSFVEYINSLRLAYSRQLLSNMDEKFTIDAIAYEVGFNSRATFYRLFHEKYGLTPKQFKQFAK